jgi:CRISPR/Cas system-associated endonuclease Cas3-HD
LIPQSRKQSKKAVKKLSKSYQNIGNIGQKAQLAKVPQSIHSDFLSRFLLDKKALKSFLHSLTICDKDASVNNNNKNKKKKIIGIP